MTATVRKGKKNRALLVLVPFVAVAILAFAFISCDTGSAPESATGPDATYDPVIDDPRPGVTARVSPSSLSLPGSAEGGDALAVLVGYFRDPQGNPVSGVQMNFTADPVNPNLTMNPSSAFTNEDGGASTQVRVDVGTPEGSYVLVAYTSPASAGPNARGQAELFIGSQYENLRITTSTLGGPYESDTTASQPAPPVVGSGTSVNVTLNAIGGVPPYTWTSTGLPLNLTLAGNQILGTIVSPATSAVSVTVTDSVGATATASYTITAF